MFNYAQIDNKGYCIGISQLSGEVKQDNMILIDEYNMQYLGRKYDVKKKKWTEEYLTIPEPTPQAPTLEERVTELQTSVDIFLLRQEGAIA